VGRVSTEQQPDGSTNHQPLNTSFKVLARGQPKRALSCCPKGGASKKDHEILSMSHHPEGDLQISAAGEI
jgi:hypothetical protein